MEIGFKIKFGHRNDRATTEYMQERILKNNQSESEIRKVVVILFLQRILFCHECGCILFHSYESLQSSVILLWYA